MSKKAISLLLVAAAIFGIFIWMQSSNVGSTWLWDISKEGTWLLPLILVSALIDSINPCAFSILLLTIAFLLSIGKLREKILLIGGAYILGIFVVYVLIGLGILQVLQIFSIPNFMGKLGAWLLIILGAINLINEFFPKFPIKLRIPHAAHHSMATMMEKASAPVAFLLGAFVGLCEFPCTGGPYLMVLGLLHDQGTYVKGLGYLLLYNLVFVLPLVVILFAASDRKLLEKVQSWQNREDKMLRFWSGIAMILLGFLILLLQYGTSLIKF